MSKVERAGTVLAFSAALVQIIWLKPGPGKPRHMILLDIALSVCFAVGRSMSSGVFSGEIDDE